MKIRIKADGVNIWLPIPLSWGGIAIRFSTKKYMTKEERIALMKTYKVCKKQLKQYKGLKIVDVETASGEKVSITL